MTNLTKMEKMRLDKINRLDLIDCLLNLKIIIIDEIKKLVTR